MEWDFDMTKHVFIFARISLNKPNKVLQHREREREGGRGANYAKYCLVLSRVWGEWIMGTSIGDYIGTTIGIQSPIPY